MFTNRGTKEGALIAAGRTTDLALVSPETRAFPAETCVEQIQFDLKTARAQRAPEQPLAAPRRLVDGTKKPPRSGVISPNLKQKIIAYIDQELETGALSSGQIAAFCALRTPVLQRRFEDAFGLSVRRFVLLRRVLRAKALMRESSATLAQISLACGFTDQPAFTRAFKRVTGLPPGAWRRCQTHLGMRAPNRGRGILTFSRVFTR